MANSGVSKVGAGAIWLTARDISGRLPPHPCIAYLVDKRGRVHATAFVSNAGGIPVRVIEPKKVTADKEFWRRRIMCAYERRAELSKETNAFRVVSSESDGTPSVTIDKYNDIWAVQTTSAGAETIKGDIIDIIIDEFKPASIIEKNDVVSRTADGLVRREFVCFGTNTATEIREGTERFMVDVLGGQKTGAYLDYRSIRKKGAGAISGRVLDAFCYQGWFACQAAANAKEVVAVDSSESAIDAARVNGERNAHNNIKFICADVFKYLESTEEMFDAIHLDPPSFVRSRQKLTVAIMGYKKLLSAALKRLETGGTLIVSSCSHHISERILEDVVTESVKKGGREAKVLFRAVQDIDHPLKKGFAEALYLKAIAVKIE